MIIDRRYLVKDEDKFLTLHPLGKKGRSIVRQRYDPTRRAILECLMKKEMTQDELVRCVVERLEKRFEGMVHGIREARPGGALGHRALQGQALGPASHR
jgi:hypothetical protein